MTLITIREEQQTDSGFTATLTIGGAGPWEIEVRDPFSPQQERELEWYFEGWLRTPFSGRVIAERAAKSIEAYGASLFEQVFESNARAYAQYCQVRDPLSALQIEIASKTPEFQALHWEAIRDPELGRSLALDCAIARKTSTTTTPVTVRPAPTINVLVVTARPGEEDDVGYRTISRPLIEAIRNAQLKVNVDLLRPGTYEALSKHLDDKPEGYYHIIHFDAHGALLRHEQFEKGVEANRFLYQARYGRSDIEPYEGVRAFLFLEGEEKGKSDPVEASELAKLLIGKQIPICLLNACQSGKQIRQEGATLESVEVGEDTRETSLGIRSCEGFCSIDDWDAVNLE